MPKINKVARAVLCLAEFVEMELDPPNRTGHGASQNLTSKPNWKAVLRQHLIAVTAGSPLPAERFSACR